MTEATRRDGCYLAGRSARTALGEFLGLPASTRSGTVNNIALGPAIGGLRMTPDVTPAEVLRLARAMTLKNAAVGLPHGGAKSGIAAPYDLDPHRREAAISAFAARIAHLTEYWPGPDMGTDETAMAWVYDEIGRSVGRPAALGGIRWTPSALPRMAWPSARRCCRTLGCCGSRARGSRSRGSARSVGTSR